jgi:DNA-binding protein H-NS
MARSPAERTSVDDIIGMLADLDAAALGKVVAVAQELRATKAQIEREAFIARVREEAAAIGLVPEQLFTTTPARKAPGAPKKGGSGGVVVPQFCSPDGMSKWSGRGKSPRWLIELEKQGHTREEFRIKHHQADLVASTEVP